MGQNTTPPQIWGLSSKNWPPPGEKTKMDEPAARPFCYIRKCRYWRRCSGPPWPCPWGWTGHTWSPWPRTWPWPWPLTSVTLGLPVGRNGFLKRPPFPILVSLLLATPEWPVCPPGGLAFGLESLGLRGPLHWPASRTEMVFLATLGTLGPQSMTPHRNSSSLSFLLLLLLAGTCC